MPFNGQGQFTPKHTWTNEANSGTPILPANFDDQDADMATGLSNAILRDGTGGPTADIPWNNFGITGLRAPNLGQDAANKAYVDTATGDRSMGGYKMTNVAAPVAGGDAVNLTYLQQFGLNTALPAQAGNARKFTRTDGANAAWAYPIMDMNALVTANATLTSTFLHVPVQMASLGQSVTLPAATGLTTGGPQYVIDNTRGFYPCGIRDNTGGLIMAVAPGGEALVSLRDNSTAAGAWAVTGSLLEPGLATIVTSAGSGAPYVVIDNNTSIHFTVSGGFLAACVLDNAGKVTSTPVAITGTANAIARTAFKIDATHVIVFFGATGTTDHQAVVLTLTGASPSYSISVGTSQALAATMNASWDGEDGNTAPRIAQLTSTMYVASYGVSAGATYAVGIAVSGTTVTIGTPVQVAASSNPGRTTTYALTTTTALVICVLGSGTYTINAAAVTVTNAATAALSAGTTVAGPSVTGNNLPPSCLLSATKALVASDSSGISVTAITISGGSTVAFGTSLQVEAGTFTNAAQYVIGGGTRLAPRMFPLAANTCLFSYYDASVTTGRVVVLTESSGTITAGTLYNGLYGSGVILQQTTSEFAVLYQDGTTNAWANKAIPFTITGSVLAQGTNSYTLDAMGRKVTATPGGVARTTAGDYVIHPQAGGTAVTVLRSNGVNIQNRGKIAVPQPLAAGSVAIIAPNRVLIGSSIATYNMEIAL